jgi:hypothetical protein
LTSTDLYKDDCPYASGAQPTILSHRKKEHPLSQGNEIIPVSVQFLFPSWGKEYFIVSPSLRNHSTESLYSHLLTEVLPKMPQLLPPIPVKSRDVLPLHHITRWWEILGPQALSQQARKATISLAGSVRKDEQDISTLPDLCELYLVEAQAASKSAGFTVRKQLVPEE